MASVRTMLGIGSYFSGEVMINKGKVNEILADMKEEERKKQEAIEAEVDKFLEGRLEYYVAMVLNRKCMPYSELVSCVSSDCPSNYEIVIKKIEDALAEYDYYDCIVSTPIQGILGYDGKVSYGLTFRRNYTTIYNADSERDQSEIVEKRQIELGLRIDMKKQMAIFEKWIEDGTYKQSVSTEEMNQVSNEKEKNNPSPIPIVFMYLVIVILLILFFVFK